MDEEMKGYLERGISALESLAQDPVIEIETKPPACPHCNRMNPMVRVQESESQGELGDFVIRAHCLHCNEVFYALPAQWDCVTSTEDAGRLIQERAEIRGFGS